MVPGVAARKQIGLALNFANAIEPVFQNIFGVKIFAISLCTTKIKKIVHIATIQFLAPF